MQSSKKSFINNFPYCRLPVYFIQSYKIAEDTRYEILNVPARSLLKAQRFDLMAKWIYIDAKEKGIDMQDARKLYTAHISAFTKGQFIEPGNAEKNSAQKYLDVFDNLIYQIKENGFDPSVSLIPVGENNVLLDGAHRCTAAAYFNQKVTIIRFANIKKNYDYAFFDKRGLDDSYMDLMAREYCYTHENIFFACFWPVAYDQPLYERSLEILKTECGDIVYENVIDLSYNAIYNLMIQIYGHQEWAGSYEDFHHGIEGKIKKCFAKKPTRIVIFESASLENTIQAKAHIRKIFGLQNHSIHISDTDEETRLMADVLLNSNSRHFLKMGHPDNYPNFNRIFAEYRKQVLAGKKGTRYIVDASSVLAVYGVRECRDLDFLTDDVEKNVLFQDGYAIDEHSDQLIYHNINVPDMLYNPQNHFVYQGMKFISLSVLKAMKQNRNEPKDKKDIKLIDGLMNGNEISLKKKIQQKRMRKEARQDAVLTWKLRRKKIIEKVLCKKGAGAILLIGMYPIATLSQRKEQWERYKSYWDLNAGSGRKG